MNNSSSEIQYTVIPKASFRPNKIVFYNQIIKTFSTPIVPKPQISQETKEELYSWGIGLKRAVAINSHNFELSKKATGRIREKVEWLYELAKNKTVITSNGKVLSSFKMNFLTLTLPALQKHSTDELTKTCLNQFFTELKAKKNLNNYVWRLEFQKNGNAHYHIATDTFLDYTECKLIWNRCLRKLGYIQDYQNKFIGMKFSDYCKNHSDNGKTPFNVLRERFGRGCATRWDSPNTVDVRSVSNAKSIAFYISKYITKKSEHALNPIVSAREPQTTNLRMWFCSRSLSALDKIEIFLQEYDPLLEKIFYEISNVKKFIFDYVSVWYFNRTEQSNECKNHLWALFRKYANERNYSPA